MTKTSRPRLLITRPLVDAQPMAEMAAAENIDPVIAPIIDIDFPERATPIDLGGICALAFTSANGVRAFAAQCEDRSLPVFAVGQITADYAHACRFNSVHVAGGDLSSLAALISSTKHLGDGEILHVAGQHRAGDLERLLTDQQRCVRREVWYEATSVSELPRPARRFLTEPGANDWISFFSPRSAHIFLNLTADADLTSTLANKQALCLSRAVADAASKTPWRRVSIGKEKTARALIDFILSGQSA